MSNEAQQPTELWSAPHHDGSLTYVPEPTPQLGGRMPVFLRVPRGSDVTSAWVRVIEDGEPELVQAMVDRQDESDTWLRADVPVVNPVVSYRWLLDGGPTATSGSMVLARTAATSQMPLTSG